MSPVFGKGTERSLCPSSLLPKMHVMEKPAWAEDRVRLMSSGMGGAELIYAVAVAVVRLGLSLANGMI